MEKEVEDAIIYLDYFIEIRILELTNKCSYRNYFWNSYDFRNKLEHNGKTKLENWKKRK